MAPKHLQVIRGHALMNIVHTMQQASVKRMRHDSHFTSAKFRKTDVRVQHRHWVKWARPDIRRQMLQGHGG
jgi:hypothetical protein